jgi:hypothetical protein
MTQTRRRPGWVDPGSPATLIDRHSMAQAWDEGYRAGASDTRAAISQIISEILVGSIELRRGMARIAIATAEQRIAERRSLLDRCAERIHSELGRPAGYCYDGGPVAWATGTPAHHERWAA